MSDRDAEYEADYRAWVAGLSQSEQERLAKQGLDQPHVDGQSRARESFPNTNKVSFHLPDDQPYTVTIRDDVEQLLRCAVEFMAEGRTQSSRDVRLAAVARELAKHGCFIRTVSVRVSRQAIDAAASKFKSYVAKFANL